MSYSEDRLYEIFDEVNNLGVKDQFDAQLEKMKHQPKHQYKEVRDRWSYAHNKVTTKSISNKKALN